MTTEGEGFTRLRLIMSPLQEPGYGSETSSERHGDVESKGGARGLALTETEAENQVRLNDSSLHRIPSFKRHEEATDIELFFDLFFVANLTIFSQNHELNSLNNLTSYIGFFCILWFTWLQVSLFDVRFVADSLFERIAKALHLGVMIGFAVVGPNFVPALISEPDSDTYYLQVIFKTIAMLLFGSRLVLTCQYLSILWHLKEYPDCRKPFLLIAATETIAAIVYLILFFVFKHGQNLRAYEAFYVIAVFETVSNIAISSIWSVLSFNETHLVQRMSLLTLIILGEGVIVLAESFTKIEVSNELDKALFEPATIGLIISCVCILYFLYMLYFDALNNRRFSNLKQQLWAFLHFPFHVALVLFLEGMAQFVTWHKLIQATFLFQGSITDVENQWTDLLYPNTTANFTAEDFESFKDFVNNTITNYTDIWPVVYTETSNNITELLETLAKGYNTTNFLYNGTDVDSSTNVPAGWLDFVDAFYNLFEVVVSSFFTTFGFEAPDEAIGGNPSADKLLTADFNLVLLVFEYFFAAAGITLFLMGCLNVLSTRHYSLVQIIRLSSFFIVGTALALLAIIGTNDTLDANFGYGPWPLPTVTLSLLLVLVAMHFNVPRFGKNRVAYRRP